MIKIIIEKKEFEIISGWHEATVKQFHEFVAHAEDLNPVRVLSILTGVSYDTLNNFDCTGFVEKVLPALSWMKDKLDVAALERKQQITIGGTTIDVIEKPEKETIGQKLRMTQIVAGVDMNLTKVPEIMPAIIANYYAPKLHKLGIWNEDHVKEVEELCWKMKFIEAAPECGFFLTGYLKF